MWHVSLVAGGPITAEGSVFVSYHRSNAEVRRWVVRVFEPLLRQRLELDGGIVGEKTVFLDERSIPDGAEWPRELMRALQRAKILVAVGSPAYFTRRWCRAELETMRSRARRTGGPCIIPVRFSDGDHYPSEVNLGLHWRDLTEFDRVKSHRQAPQALVRNIKDIAMEVRQRLDGMPEDPEWSFIDPGPLEPLPIPQPHLGGTLT